MRTAFLIMKVGFTRQLLLKNYSRVKRKMKAYKIDKGYASIDEFNETKP